MNLEEVDKRLDELEARYQEWAAPINRVIQENRYKVNRDGYTGADYDRDVRQARDAQLSKFDPYQEMNAFFDELCPTYLSAAEEQREKIREAAGDKDGVLHALLGYIYRSANRIQSPSDSEWLRRGLAVVSIENCCRDYRDVLLALAELYVTAEEAGLDPIAEFKAVAKLSSKETPRGGNTPVSKMLSRFHTYAVLKEHRQKK